MKNIFLFMFPFFMEIIILSMRGKVNSLEKFYIIIFPLLIYFIVAFIFSYFKDIKKSNSYCKIKTIMTISVLLVILDQIVKLFIEDRFTSGKYMILKDWYFISNVKNYHNSQIFNILDISIPLAFIVIMKVVIVVFMIFLYSYNRNNSTNKWNGKYWLDSFFIFSLSGIICSILDTVLWGASLDFIGLKSYFTFDIKDIYITIGISAFSVYAFNISLRIKASNFKEEIFVYLKIVNNFIKFVKNDLINRYMFITNKITNKA